MQPADRIAGFRPYFFARLGQKIEQLRASGVDVIRLDMGSPDLPPADFIIEALTAAARRPDMHGYMPYGGTQGYRQAAARYYQKRYGVELDPETQVLGLLGSKEGIFHLSQVLLNPGDISLVPDPGYPTYGAGARIAGAEVCALPLAAGNEFRPDLSAIPAAALERARVLWINYPNNPTGATADLEFLERAVEFARTHDLVLLHDAPYLEVCFDGYQAPSVLQVPGASDVAVEINSLSKTYNMAGWRLGMAVGNAETLRYLKTYKSQLDSSHFGPIMVAGAAALLGDQGWIRERNQRYQERRDRVLEGLSAVGLDAHRPRAALYIWARLPEGQDGPEFCARLLEEAGVSTTPGIVYGSAGAEYFRLSLCTPLDRIEEAMERIKDWRERQV